MGTATGWLASIDGSLDAASLRALKRALARDAEELPEPDRQRCVAALEHSRRLSLGVEMRRELVALWQRSTATHEELLARLQDWCRRAEDSGVRQLEEFSLRLRRYII